MHKQSVYVFVAIGPFSHMIWLECLPAKGGKHVFRAFVNRSLVLHSTAEGNGVFMLREGGHRPRDARAFLSVCGLHSDITKIDHKKNTPHTQRKERPSLT